jgi:hypothetical protein
MALLLKGMIAGVEQKKNSEGKTFATEIEVLNENVRGKHEVISVLDFDSGAAYQAGKQFEAEVRPELDLYDKRMPKIKFTKVSARTKNNVLDEEKKDKSVRV